MTTFLATVLSVPLYACVAILLALAFPPSWRRGAWVRLQVAWLRLSSGRDLKYLAFDYGPPDRQEAPAALSRVRAAADGFCRSCEEQLRGHLRSEPLRPSIVINEKTFERTAPRRPYLKGGYSPEPRVYDLDNLPNAPMDPPFGAPRSRQEGQRLGTGSCRRTGMAPSLRVLCQGAATQPVLCSARHAEG